ncbi:MAG: hypothetical protein ABW172_04340, partial [Candidatus Binatia bacterium]
MKILLSLLSLAVALLLAVPRVSSAADKIRLGYGSMSVHYAPIWIAGEAQLYQKNGLDAEVLY